MSEDRIRELAREEALKLMRPLVLAIRQGNRLLDREIEQAFELGEFKKTK